MQGDRSSTLSRGDGSGQSPQPASDYRHGRHTPYHTVWYVSAVLRRSDWLEAGLAALAEDGPNSLRIDRLCRRLKVSKGSFHHHFAGARDFKQSLLIAYEKLVVESLDRAIDQTEGATPQATLANLTAAITSPQGFYRPELEVAMRAWAFSDPEVRSVQERVDLRRLDSLQAIWSKIYGDPAEARIAALLPYLVAIGASLAQPPTPLDELKRVYQLLMGLVADPTRGNGP
jgi:AcrR family transcriptional regulator